MTENYAGPTARRSKRIPRWGLEGQGTHADSRKIIMKQRYHQDPCAPRPEHPFAFGPWTVGNSGVASSGEPRRYCLALGERSLVVEADFVKAV